MKLCIHCVHYKCISVSEPKNPELAKCFRSMGVSPVTGAILPVDDKWCSTERSLGECGHQAFYFQEINHE